MASGSQLMTTYYAKRIVGDASAAQADKALLQTGTNVVADTWILNRTNRATIYGIKYVYDGTDGHDKVEFYGGSATASAWVQLDTGDAYISGRMEIGGTNDSYKLYVNGSARIDSLLTLYREGSTTDNKGTGIQFENKDTTTNQVQTAGKTYIFAYNTHSADDNGMNMVIRPGGNLFIGGGESSGNLYALNTTSTTENLYATADSTIYLEAGAQAIANRIGIAIDDDGTIIPVKAEAENNNAQNIGTNATRWKIGYFSTSLLVGAAKGITAYNSDATGSFIGAGTISSCLTAAGGGYYLFANGVQYGRMYISAVGTANSGDGYATRGAQGYTTLQLGNSTPRPAAGTEGGADNSRGRILLYHTDNTYTTIDSDRWVGHNLTILGTINSTANETGSSGLILGNANKKSEATAASYGYIRIYGEEANYHNIYPGAPNDNRSHYLPNATGWIVTGGNGTSTGEGDSNTPVYLKTDGTLEAITSYDGNSATATALTSNAGGTEQPIYFTGGKPAATSYALKATVNNGTTAYLAYYSGARAISSWSAAKFHDGCLSLFPTTGSYREGLRIHSTGSWSDITLCGNDNTGDSGTSANSWFLGNNNGNFYIARNGSPGSTAWLECVNNIWSTMNPIWIKGGSTEAGTNANRLTTSSGTPGNMQYNSNHRGVQIYSNGIAFADPYNGNSNNDAGWIRHIEETANTGTFEFAVGDDNSNEAIVFRRYTTSNTVDKEAYIFDASGDSSFPGTVTATKFSGPLTGNVTGNCSGSSGSCTGNAATATNADKVDNYHAADLWRKDGGTWNGNANIACTPTANNQEYSFDLGNAYTGTYWHVWSGKNSKTILACYNDDMSVSVPNGTLTAKAFSGPLTGNVTGNCSGSSGSCTGNAATASKVGEAASWLYFNHSNEVNFGGTYNSNAIIYFGYRATDSRAKPDTYVFGSGNGTATVKASTFIGALTGNVTGNCSGSAGSVAWANTGHPSTFPPSAHTHTWLELAPGNKAATTGAAQSDDTGPFTVRWYSASGKIAQQPSTYGFLITCAAGKGSSEQHALWLEQCDGHIYHRGTNGGNNTSPPAFRKLWQQGDAVTSAVWNDYAEARTASGQPGQVVYELGDDTCIPTTERLQHFAGIVSDTWGFSQGETTNAKTHIAVAGRVLAYPYHNRNEYKPGDVLCAAPGGTVDIMTREEIIQYPDRIVGTVSCVPMYEEWGGGEGADRPSVKVNGRIWVKVK